MDSAMNLEKKQVRTRTPKNYCDSIYCIYCCNEKCSILNKTDKNQKVNCAFKKTNVAAQKSETRVKDRIISLRKQGNLAVISQIFEANKEIIADPDMLDIYLEVKKYRARFKFDFQKPKVYSTIPNDIVILSTETAY